MVTVWFKGYLGQFASLVLCLFTLAVAAETDNPHLVNQNTAQTACNDCHKLPMPIQIKEGEWLLTKNISFPLDQLKTDGIAMCITCHDPNAVHKVGLEIDFPVPADLPLNEKNAMICRTCHYTHGSLRSDRPQASFSFIDRLIDPERLQKSYLLRRNNLNGELCLICHNVSSTGSR